MLGLVANARLLGRDEMDVDEKNSTNELVAYNAPMPYDTNGLVIHMPVTSIVGALVGDLVRWLAAVGNCPCRPDGMGNNNSKFVRGVKAATKWLFENGDVPINSVVIDYSLA